MSRAPRRRFPEHRCCRFGRPDRPGRPWVSHPTQQAAGCAKRPLVLPFWGLTGSGGVLWVLDRVYALGRNAYIIEIISLFMCTFPGAYSRIHQSIRPVCPVIASQRPSRTARSSQFRWPRRAPAGEPNRSLSLPGFQLRFRPGLTVAPVPQSGKWSHSAPISGQALLKIQYLWPESEQQPTDTGYPAVRPIMSAMRAICSPGSTADEQAARPSRSTFR